MVYRSLKIFRTFSFFTLFAAMLASCGNQDASSGQNTIADSLKGNEQPAVTIERDLPDILEDSVLNAITIYSSTSYFLYRGLPMGFEYDLLKNLADELGVALKITVAQDIDELFTMLNEGKGDMIAYGLTVTEPRKEMVEFTHHHYVTHQCLVQRKPENWRKIPPYKMDRYLMSNTLEMLEDTIWVRENSSYWQRVNNLAAEMGGPIYLEPVSGNRATDEIIRMVANGQIERTVADYNIASINQTYYPQLDISTPVSLSQRCAWAVRKNSPKLLDTLNTWIRNQKKHDLYYVIYNKYFKNKKGYNRRVKSELYSKSTGKISPYDELIKAHAEDLDWDWRLLGSQVYQESRFDPNAKSWAGARGLMQLMPATARSLGVTNPTNPEASLKGGTRYLQQLYGRFDNVEDTVQRIKFVLASFNCGYGHVRDAQRLTETLGGNPLVWDDEVEKYLLKLSQRDYYNHEKVKYGYVRASEPYKYVREIFKRFEHYKQLVPDASESDMASL